MVALIYYEVSSIKSKVSNYIKLEVFNKDGLLIDEIPLKMDIAPFNNCLYIKENRLFIINNNDVSITEYRIIS